MRIDPTLRYTPIVATMTALIVCIRFSAWSNTIDRSDSKTSFGDLEPVEAELLEDLLADLGVAVVERRQAVHELHLRVAGLRHQLGVDLVRLEQLDPLVPDGRRPRPSRPRRRCRGSRRP